MEIRQFNDIDWNKLWREAKKKKTWKKKDAGDWDRRADSFAARTASSVYQDKFIEKLDPPPSWSVLDVGSGPGTLALPLASRVRRVAALDFSERMLAILRERAQKKGLANITTFQLSWNDDWSQHDVGQYDLVIASRSLAVKDLRQALEKLTRHARKLVCITDRVRHGPFDPDAFTAIGRPMRSGPDFIYTVNLLYQMGHLPRVDFIHLREDMQYRSFQDALEGYRWMFQHLTEDEEKRLQDYIHSISSRQPDGTISLRRKHVPVWAFITWQPKGEEQQY